MNENYSKMNLLDFTEINIKYWWASQNVILSDWMHSESYDVFIKIKFDPHIVGLLEQVGQIYE